MYEDYLLTFCIVCADTMTIYSTFCIVCADTMTIQPSVLYVQIPCMCYNVLSSSISYLILPGKDIFGMHIFITHFLYSKEKDQAFACFFG